MRNRSIIIVYNGFFNCKAWEIKCIDRLYQPFKILPLFFNRVQHVKSNQKQENRSHY